MKNLFYVILLVCLLPTTLNAQQLGFSSNPTFNTDASGGQVGHLQSGTFGDVLGSGQWIGIGEPNIGPTAYGMRIQEGSYFGTFSLVPKTGLSTVGARDLDILWGGSTSNLNFNYASNSTSPPIKRMSILSNGRVIVGDLSNVGSVTRAALTVVETSSSGGSGIDINATSGRNPNLLFSINNTIRANIRILDSADDRMEFQTGSSLTTRMTLLQNGNFGIGTANPSDKLHVNGDVSIAGSLSVASDQRFKKDINKIESPMSLLEGLNGMTYEYDQTAFPEKEFIKGKTLGFIAQDFEKDLPELIKKDNEGYYSVNYLGVIPILVEALKEVNEEKEDLRTELDELKSLVNDLIKTQDLNNDHNANKQSGLMNSSGNVKATLFQNAPNPSNGSTKITYQVNEANAQIDLIVYDTKGNEVSRFQNLSSGNQSIELNENLTNGIYLYTLFVDGIEIDTKRLVISK